MDLKTIIEIVFFVGVFFGIWVINKRLEEVGVITYLNFHEINNHINRLDRIENDLYNRTEDTRSNVDSRPDGVI